MPNPSTIEQADQEESPEEKAITNFRQACIANDFGETLGAQKLVLRDGSTVVCLESAEFNGYVVVLDDELRVISYEKGDWSCWHKS